jgi:hypothetical protein
MDRKMERALKTTYFRLLVPALLTMVLLFAAKSAADHLMLRCTGPAFAGPLIFIALQASSAWPCRYFYRTLFSASPSAIRSALPAADLLAFERRFLW